MQWLLQRSSTAYINPHILSASSACSGSMIDTVPAGRRANLEGANAVTCDALLVSRQLQHLRQSCLDGGHGVQQRGHLHLQQLPVQVLVVLHIRAKDAYLHSVHKHSPWHTENCGSTQETYRASHAFAGGDQGLLPPPKS